MKKQIVAAVLLLGLAAASCKKNNIELPGDAANAEANSSSTCKGKRIFGVYCQDVYRPVCGCDGVTYSNSCYAYISGVKSWTEGACDGSGGPIRTK